jgi:hypothetical protein
MLRWLAPCARPLGLGGLLLLLLYGTGCASTIRGQVLDAQTGQPIPGAVVLGVWTKGVGIPGLPQTELVGVRESETDAEGRFVLESLGGLFIEQSVAVYKFGYIAWSNEFVFPSFKRRPDTSMPAVIRLESFPAGWSHPEHMRFISLATRSSLYFYENKPKFQRALEREIGMR